MSQKDVFLSSEADAWYERNEQAVAKVDYSVDPVSASVLEIATTFPTDTEHGKIRILEIGCGEGQRLE
jgi:hypothetical protein